MDKITRNEAYKRGFIVWESNEAGVFYARSQNRDDEDYGKVYLIKD